MSLAKLQIRIAQEMHARGIVPDPDDPDLDTEVARRILPKELKDVFLHFGSLSFLRRFYFVAVKLYVADVFEEGRPGAGAGE